jgi:hypothetical protein
VRLRTSLVVKKKAEVVMELPKAFGHVGLYCNELPGEAELLFL